MSHSFRHAGLRVRATNEEVVPGGGFFTEYYEVYVCEKCLEMRARKLDLGLATNSFEPPLYGATPLPSVAKTRWMSDEKCVAD